MAQAAMIAGAFVYALALTTLGAAWALGRAPRSYREVVLHVVIAGAVAALAAPYAVVRLLAIASRAANADALPAALGLTPLAIVIGLPVALVSGMAFALVALHRPTTAEPEAPLDVQPFR